MSYSAATDHDEDISQNIMEQISAALLINPDFNFGKLMALSNDINSGVNKRVLSDIITLAFLTHLDMNDAAAALSSNDLAASAGFSALRLDDKNSLEWFIRFITVMNPGLISSLAQTLMSVVNGIMIKNTRVNDAHRLDTVKTKLNKFVESGEVKRRADEIDSKKPEKNRSRSKGSTDYGLIGWIKESASSGSGSSSRSKGKDSSSSKSKKSTSKHKTSSKSDRRSSVSSTTSSNKKATSPGVTLREIESTIGERVKPLSQALSEISVKDEEIRPEDSASNVSSVAQKSPVKSATSIKTPDSRKLRFSSRDDSIVSG